MSDTSAAAPEVDVKDIWLCLLENRASGACLEVHPELYNHNWNGRDDHCCRQWQILGPSATVQQWFLIPLGGILKGYYRFESRERQGPLNRQ